MKNTIDAADIEKAIYLLNKYSTEPSIKPLILILEALEKDLDNESLLAELTDTWNNLGVFQGAVLTYAPKFHTLISSDIFGDKS